MPCEWSSVLKKISHDPSLSGENVIEKIKKELQSYPAVYKEWENADQYKFKVASLFCAVDEGCVKVVKHLLENGADVNVVDIFGRTPLHLAITNDNLNVVEALLEAKGININVAERLSGWTPLHCAAYYKGYIEIVEALLKNGADVNATDEYGKTPLHNAAEKSHIKVVEALLKKGAKVNAASQYGWTPLNYAAKLGHAEVVKALLTKDVKVNEKGCDGWTPLHLAIQNGNLNVVEALLEAKGIDVNAVDIYGWTPLHCAAHGGHIKVVKALLKKGANPIKVLNSCPYEGIYVNREIGKLLNEAEKKINWAASNLFWADYENEQKEAEKIIEFSKQEGNLAVVLESGLWLQCLFISKGKAKELAKKDNKYNKRNSNKAGNFQRCCCWGWNRIDR